MLKINYTKRFDKDLKKVVPFSKKIEKLKAIIILLAEEKPLPLKNQDHKLSGSYNLRRECHIEPDLLLIYKLDKMQIIFERIGSHSELFK